MKKTENTYLITERFFYDKTAQYRIYEIKAESYAAAISKAESRNALQYEETGLPFEIIKIEKINTL